MSEGDNSPDVEHHTPTLYKLSESGALVQWSVHVETVNPVDGPVPREVHAVVVTRWGQEGGAQQETREVVTHGKNVGKKNETTPHQQALAEAQSKWEKQQKARKYVPDREKALAGERSELVQGGVDCMLAFPREKKPNALKFPCAVQRKYDGHRLLAHVKDGQCELWSRTRKPVRSIPHVQRALESQFPVGEHWFDGEAYTMALSFEELTSLLRKEGPAPGHEVIEYHVYDVANLALDFFQRWSWLHSRRGHFEFPLVLAPTVIVDSEEELQEEVTDFLEAGYEGAMARNLDGLYVGKRSPDLLKLKKFVDAEYECLAVEYDTRTVTDSTDSTGTREVKYPVFLCRTPSGKDFRTPMMGELAVVQALAPSIPGKKLTVRFQELTKEGVPRFPKARLYVAL